jgi:citrate synthase
MAAAAGALYGPHGGAPNDELIKMLEKDVKGKLPDFLQQVKEKNKILWGFGSPIYKNAPDPRVKLCKSLFLEVVETFGKLPLIQLAIELEEAVLKDDYFLKRKITPNINFYTGLIYYAIGFPTDMYPVLFAIPRAVGWLAHWVEGILEKGARIYRPRQIYKGEPPREVPKERHLEVDHRSCLVSSLDPRVRMSLEGEEPVAKLLRGSTFE